MGHALRAGAFLVAAGLALSLLLLVAGLAMVARPDAFLGLGLADPRRTGLEASLMAGLGAIACAILLHILDLLLEDSGGENGA